MLDKTSRHGAIRPGMIITGLGVTHASQVVAIRDNVVTLSVASTIADSTSIRFS